MGRHPLVQMLGLGAIASVVGVAISLVIDWFPEQGSTAADDIDLLYDVLLVVSVPIFVLVMTIAIYSVWRFRARPGDTRDGEPIHGDTRLEIIWVVVPFIIVTSLAVYGYVVLDDIEDRQPNEMQVEVTGQQYAWAFRYPPQRPGMKAVTSEQLMLPVGRPVQFKIEAKDVLHSFWVPAFRLKSDAVPGIETTVRLTPSKEGSHAIVCAELCGIGHATMRQTVRVVPEAEFNRWLQDRQRNPTAPTPVAAAAPRGAASPVATAAGPRVPSGL